MLLCPTNDIFKVDTYLVENSIPDNPLSSVGPTSGNSFSVCNFRIPNFKYLMMIINYTITIILSLIRNPALTLRFQVDNNLSSCNFLYTVGNSIR